MNTISSVDRGYDYANITISPRTADYSYYSYYSYYDGVGSEPSCLMPLNYIKLITLAIAMLVMIPTLILIPCHRRLRKQHHIFPYNLVLSDLSGAIALVCFEAGPNLGLPIELYDFANIVWPTSNFVSLLSIALVAGYQFITIRVDPFGSRNIITTPRLIMTCIVTWVLGFTGSSFVFFFGWGYIVILSLSLLTTIATGLCYLFIYRSIARVPWGGGITQERNEENQRVLRTFGLIFGTTVLCWICPWVTWAWQIHVGYYFDICLLDFSEVMISANWIANSIIYWWRLKEFRLIFGFCRKQRIDPIL